MASRMVRCRGGRSRCPPSSRRRRSVICASNAAGERILLRAAASSMASGNPSTRWQIAATLDAFFSVNANAGRTARARSMNRLTASFRSRISRDPAADGGSGNGSMESACSPRTCNGARLVARICSAGQASRMCATTSATPAMRCSQLSKRSKVCRGRRWRSSASAIGWCGAAVTSRALASAPDTSAGSASGARSIQTTPSAKELVTSPAIASASRVLPTPPGPVSVSSGTASSSKKVRADTRSASRPIRRVRGWGSDPPRFAVVTATT